MISKEEREKKKRKEGEKEKLYLDTKWLFHNASITKSIHIQKFLVDSFNILLMYVE